MLLPPMSAFLGGRLGSFLSAKKLKKHRMTAPEDSEKSPPVIMIVDADPHVRELAGYFLAEAGYKVEYALDGYDALDRVRKTPPAVLLVDIIVPKLDGLALCRLVKSDPVTENIRVVVFSEILALNRAQNAKNACADSFLSKPLEKTRLLNTVAEMIGPPARSNLL
jgi:CheY-like chemotaxis protein